MNNNALEEAIGWTIRLRDAAPEDWRAFTAWLEASPDHLAAYDEVQRTDAALDTLPFPPARPVIVDRPPAHAPVRSRRGWLVGGGFATVVGGVLTTLLVQTPATYALETRPGEMRTVALADGSRIAMNGGTRLILDRKNERFAQLERGEALFTVVHDDDRPFEVRAGDDVLQDIGTVFAVLHEAGATEVAVSDGAVLYNPDGEAVRIDPGRKLSDDGGDRVLLTQVDASTVGSWRDKRLSYTGAPISRVAADLHRNLGVPVGVDPSLQARRFTGMVQLDGGTETVFERLSALMGVRAVRSGAGWMLTAGDRR
ncbi:FecR family protein [Sphingomonas sp.]|jgi:transmembrane sensor|uniref:FecR family protein n=1 Tax=Sphingomonas sp. TaxID=28214 RepID=UPI002DE73EB8|nr:FecR domain-containing protein [Sphingomonas sp.]